MGGIVALLLADAMPNGLGSLTLAEGNLVGTDAFMSGKIAARSESAFVKELRILDLGVAFLHDRRKRSPSATLLRFATASLRDCDASRVEVLRRMEPNG